MFRSSFLPSRQIRVKNFSDLKIAFFKITHCKKNLDQLDDFLLAAQDT
jgi:hypothetical protein